ncbi:TFIIB-type zinc ribbon-containing protein [Paenibacillus sp. UMB4589-SE434]|uniref:TFIIB-type zinc ribbon-containing protein n=1 Tax=Paenibacillus sp. UMB4589-SE434 TaxID=3046314 RepID=UPI00254D0AC5|nr:TFIIB-type zinc ribbon-containing protein [Paenibacillus sp. UMB4589-SE434]MDK8183538.1 TFIIB-type zinc ribbon-containing protein [Paenibacillus sp. UMB4589-SE434]
MPVIEYKCPNCGSGMTFDVKTGMLSCHSCGRKDNIEQIPDPLTKHVFSEEDEAREYHCTSCGAVIMTEAETSATSCSFCGSAVVLGDRLIGKLAPAKIIPFTISKEQAMMAFRKWCRRGTLTPRGFMSANRIKEITGMYVPFWLYDLHNDVEVHGSGTKVSTYTSGDYEYTKTDYFQIYRRLCLDYVKVPIDAAEKMNDELMDKLEPFAYDQLESFKTPYLAGYIAERYSYNDEELFPRAKDKIYGYIDAYIDSTTNAYTSVSYADVQIDTTIERADYVLLPVWVIHYDYNQSKYTFAMNGQTGKVVGKPPISKAKVAAWFAGISGISFLVLQLLTFWIIGGRT